MFPFSIMRGFVDEEENAFIIAKYETCSMAISHVIKIKISSCVVYKLEIMSCWLFRIYLVGSRKRSSYLFIHNDII